MSLFTEKILKAFAIATCCFITESSAMHNRYPQNSGEILLSTGLCTFMKERDYISVYNLLEETTSPITFDYQNISIKDMYWLILSALECDNKWVIKKIFNDDNYGINPMFLVVNPRCNLLCEDLEGRVSEFTKEEFTVVAKIKKAASKSLQEFFDALVGSNPGLMLAYAKEYKLKKLVEKIQQFIKNKQLKL